MRVVLDTNIFISAILCGRLGIIIDEWRAGKLQLIITDEIALEYLDVINRPKFKIPQIEILTVTEYLLHNAEFVTPLEEILVIVADATDNKFLEAAVAGTARGVLERSLQHQHQRRQSLQDDGSAGRLPGPCSHHVFADVARQRGQHRDDRVSER